MQFEYSHNIGKDTALVEFTGYLYKLSKAACLSMLTSLERIGGKVDLSNFCLFHFPLFITSQIIQEIIHNTCFVCGGLMTDSQALQNTWTSSDDFGNDAGSIGTTQSQNGPAKMIRVRKCATCGHSHT